MTVSASILGAAGLALLFAPAGLLALYGVVLPPPELALAQLLGAALLGNAVLNWLARQAVLGGIYGRPLAVGNLTHCLLGGLVLLRAAIGGANRPAVWATAALYLGCSIGFAWVMFARSLPRANRT
jgi:hypothetical protein